MKHPSLLAKETIDPLLVGVWREMTEQKPVAPHLFVNLADGRQERFLLGIPDELEGRAGSMAALGEHVRLTSGPIAEALILVKAWCVNMIFVPAGPEFPQSPHLCPHEAIVVVGRNARNTRHAWVVQPFLRDSKGSPSDKLPADVAYDQPQPHGVPLLGWLDSFFDGAETAKIEVPF